MILREFPPPPPTLNLIFPLLMWSKKSLQSSSDTTEILSLKKFETFLYAPQHFSVIVQVLLPCNSVFDVVEQTLWHEGILIQVHQVGSLQREHKRETVYRKNISRVSTFVNTQQCQKYIAILDMLMWWAMCIVLYQTRLRLCQWCIVHSTQTERVSLTPLEPGTSQHHYN